MRVNTMHHLLGVMHMLCSCYSGVMLITSLFVITIHVKIQVLMQLGI